MASAEPVLAATLWMSHLGTEPARGADAATSLNLSKLATGSKGLDVLLEGGLDHGLLTCITSEPADGNAVDVLLNILISSLSESANSTAAVIESPLSSLDLRELHRRLIQKMRSGDPEISEDEASRDALARLARVRIMKVFDFVGMIESVGELRKDLEKGPNSAASVSWPLGASARPPRGTISDSEDEDDEMLDSPSPLSHADPLIHSSSSGAGTQPIKPDRMLLMITNIASLVIPLLRNKNHVQGQALLVSFIRSLKHLSSAHNLCTVMMSHTATTYNGQSFKDEAPPSVFSSCDLRPALGKTFNQLLDIHLLMHQIPKTADDARRLAGGAGGTEEVDMESIIEVLKDRSTGRVARWASVKG